MPWLAPAGAGPGLTAALSSLIGLVVADLDAVAVPYRDLPLDAIAVDLDAVIADRRSSMKSALF